MNRDRVLEILGYESYGKYLKGPDWRVVRQKAWASLGGRCGKCGVDRGVHVHHASYRVDNMGSSQKIRRKWAAREREGLNPIPDVWLLCRDCHEALHSGSGWSLDGLRESTGEFLGWDGAPPTEELPAKKSKRKKRKWRHKPLKAPKFEVGKPRVRRKKDN